MRLRSFLLLLFCTFFIFGDSVAQKLEVGVLGGYRTGGSFRFDRVGPLGQISSTHFDTESGADFNFHINAPLQEYASAELIFDFQNTTMSTSNQDSELQKLDVKIYTIHAGGLYTTSQDKIRPILGGSMGISIFNPADNRSNSTRFSLGFTGGAKAYLSESFGLRAHTRLVMALVQSADFFCGPGAGSCYTAGGSLFTQISFSLGAFIRI